MIETKIDRDIKLDFYEIFRNKIVVSILKILPRLWRTSKIAASKFAIRPSFSGCFLNARAESWIEFNHDRLMRTRRPVCFKVHTSSKRRRQRRGNIDICNYVYLTDSWLFPRDRINFRTISSRFLENSIILLNLKKTPISFGLRENIFFFVINRNLYR